MQEAMKRWILAAGVAAFLAEPCMAFMGSPLAQPSGMRPPAVVQQRRPRAFQVLFNGKEQQARRGHARNGACGDAWVQSFRVNGCAYFGWPSSVCVPNRHTAALCVTIVALRCVDRCHFAVSGVGRIGSARLEGEWVSGMSTCISPLHAVQSSVSCRHDQHVASLSTPASETSSANDAFAFMPLTTSAASDLPTDCRANVRR